MKIPNYDPDFLTATYYKQGHPCMPTGVFQMLICGPSNSGKTSILLHMLYNLLEYDKVYLFSKNLHQTKYRALFKTLPQKSTSNLVARSSRRQGMRLFHLKSFRWTTKRLSSWFVKAAITPSSTISSTGGTKTAALFISLNRRQKGIHTPRLGRPTWHTGSQRTSRLARAARPHWRRWRSYLTSDKVGQKRSHQYAR